MKTIDQLKRVDKGINARPLHVFCVVGQVKVQNIFLTFPEGFEQTFYYIITEWIFRDTFRPPEAEISSIIV